MEFAISLDHLGGGPVGSPALCAGALVIVPSAPFGKDSRYLLDFALASSGREVRLPGG